MVQGSKLARDAHQKLQDIETVSSQLAELIESISLASKQQSRASDNIAKTMEEVGEISSQTSAASKQTAMSMQGMAETAENLRQSVEAFKLDGEGTDSREQPETDVETPGEPPLDLTHAEEQSGEDVETLA